MHFNLRTLLLFLTIINGVSNVYQESNKVEITVGALFFKDENDIELGFEQALHDVNVQFFNYNFTAIKRYVPRDDSIVLQQMTCELISDGVAAIFGPSSKATSDIVALIANRTGIPHLLYDGRSDSPLQLKTNRQMTVNVAPSITVVARALVDIVKTDYRWRSYMLVYQTEEGLIRLQDLMNVQPLKKDNVKIRNLADYKDDYRVLWKEVAEIFREPHVVLDCEPTELESVMKAALPFRLLGPFRSWFLTNLDTHSSRLREIYNADFQANITAVRIKVADINPFTRRKTHITRVDEILANQTMLPTLIYDAVILYANSISQIITLLGYWPPEQNCKLEPESSTPWTLGLEVVKLMTKISEDDVKPNFKTENMKFNELGQRVEFNLEIFKPTVNEPMALWKPDGKIGPIKSIFSFESKSDLPDFSQIRKKYTVVTKFGEPYFMMKEDHETRRGMDKYEGYAVDLIQKLSETMNFEYEFDIVETTGIMNPVTKEWNGLIRKLIDHQAQIGICDLTITQSRRQVVDFTVPFMQLGIKILYYREEPVSKSLFAFLDPFEAEVWVYLLIVQFVMTLMFVLIARFSYIEWLNTNPCIQEAEEIENIWASSNSTWLMVGSIMQQGCDIMPRGPPMRLLNGIWWFFALMILSTYTANLAAFLTSAKNKNEINSLEDLIGQDKVKYGTNFGGSTSLFFSESNETDFMRAWNQMVQAKPSVFTKDNKEGVTRVAKEKGKYAFLMETTGLTYEVERNCDLKPIGEQIGEKHYGLAVPLGADYRTNLSVALLRLSERGDLNRIKSKWWTKDKVKCEFHEADGDELSLYELGGVFLVLGGGMLVAIFLGICEFLWNVQRVAVEQRLMPCEAFKAELLFVVKFWMKKKPTQITEVMSSSKSSSTPSERRSSAQSRSHSRDTTEERTVRSKKSSRHKSD